MISFHNRKIELHGMFTRSKHSSQVDCVSPKYVKDAAMRLHLVFVALNGNGCAGVVVIIA